MKICCVPGCNSHSTKSQKLHFYSFPSKYANGVIDPIQNTRRLEWLKLIQASDRDDGPSRSYTICSKHFVKGHPARQECVYDTDWVPSINLPQNVYCIKKDESVDAIIKNLPDVVVQFDVPDYIVLDRVTFNEKQIEMDLIQKLAPPICDLRGFYLNDHNYVRPIDHLLDKTEDLLKEHNYSLAHQPACFYLNSEHFCNICRYNFDNLFSFNKHMMLHTTKNDVHCCICPMRFLTSSCLNNHLNTHTSRCGQCGVEVPAVQLGAHKSANLKQKYKKSDILKYRVSAQRRVYFCVYCMKTLSNEKAYSRHVFQHKKLSKMVKT